MTIKNQSSWEMHTDKAYPKLNAILDTDVVIVGAGITGIFNAYMLAQSGVRVVVLEEEENIVQGVTRKTTAFIESAIDTSFTELITLFGIDRAKLVYQSGQDAIQLFADIIAKEKIDCDYQTVSAYTYATTEKEFRELTREYTALKKS